MEDTEMEYDAVKKTSLVLSDWKSAPFVRG